MFFKLGKKNAVFLLFFLFLFILSSCNFNSSNNNDNFNSGFSFYKVKISDLNPNGIVYVDSDDFSKPLFIEVENEMFYDSDNFVIVPSNYNNYYISLDKVKDYFKSNPWSFKGTYSKEKDVKSLNTDISFKTNKDFPYSTTVDFFACSDVKTFFSDSVCFSPLNDHYDKVCDEGKVFYNGQGAPVGVVSLETSSIGSKGVLKFTIANKYDGNVYSRSKSIIDECSFIPVEDYGVVKLDYVKIGNKNISLDNCNSKIAKLGFDRKYQKYKSFTFECIFDKKSFDDVFNSNTNLKLNVEILLSYSYSKLVKKESVVIKNALGYSNR